ncbi:hypothetical protein D9615_004412 [Tricholomella constricta]|uniref:Uncharacterized protein n=1 Tax=Tricholomella constricta TaxID=117010 RepID=A0A8H5M5N2_9AGAR|nr:hypothetical protein D9615_004412 [Tricholomella constricta]
MHVTRPPGLPALAIVMPRPQLPRSRSSVPSSLSSPRTPRTPSCSSNSLFTTITSNRNSTDSWNSSNAADDLECDWKPEQVRLLSRTLDALPAHLVTPFNGPIPPSNLLDRIARGVSQAKGPIDWPHSIRATRVKLIELSRARAKEEQSLIAEVYSDMETDASSDRPNYRRYPDSSGKGISIKRPLYRQSSMDFMKAADLRDDDKIDWYVFYPMTVHLQPTPAHSSLSDRLQRTDRLISKAAYHPYSRHVSRSRLSSPACSASLINPSTPSSSTLNTLSSFSSANCVLRRTSSNLSSTSASSISMMSSNGGAALSDPRVQRVRRSDSFYAPVPPPKDLKLAPSIHKENLKDSPSTAGMKRAPSFGAIAQEARRDRHIFGGALNNAGKEIKDSSAYPSSDEEEKIRSKGAKKMRVKDFGGLAPAVSLSTGTPSSPPSLAGSNKRTRKTPGTAPACLDCKPPASPKSPTPKSKKKSGVLTSRDLVAETDAKPAGVPAPAKERRKPRPTVMNLQRNPSMFGAELPHLSAPSSPPAPIPEARSRLLSSPAHFGRLAESVRVASPEPSPTSVSGALPKVKTLRRVQRLTLGRRISFGSLVALGDDADGEAEGDDEDARGLRKERQRQRDLGQLGSAFQLH